MTARRKRNLLDAALSETAMAACVLDDERRVRFFSGGMEALTGWPADQIKGLKCAPFVAPNATPVDLLTSGLAPSADVLNGVMESTTVVLPHRNGTGVKMNLVFVPIPNADGIVSRVLIAHHDAPAAAPVGTSLTQKLHAEVTSLRNEFRRRFSDQSFLGDCPAIRKALFQAELLKASECGYSILGPPGSGRRHLARLIHVAGQHHEQSFVALDCRLLLPDHLLDTLGRLKQLSPEHQGAPHRRVGTLLLIDADRCPREVQQAIVEDFAAELTGVRLVAMTSDSLLAAEQEGWLLPEFRALFSTLQIELPPLHQRGDDIVLLAQHFIEECQRTLETSAEGMTNDVERELRFYRWPGNVRELRDVITAACEDSFSVKLEIDDLPFAFRAGQDAQQLPQTPDAPVQSLEEIMLRFEADVLTQTLQACDGNKAEAARRLGMTRPRLYRRLKTLGLDDDHD